MELKIYFTAIRKSWWLIALSVLLALSIVLVSILLTTPLYRASAQFIVYPNVDTVTRGGDLVDSLGTLDRRSIITTYAEVINNNRFLSETLEDVGLPNSVVDDISISVVPLPDANIVKISIEGPDPEIVMILANNLGQRSTQFMNEIYPVYNITFLSAATLPTKPISPTPVRDISLAVVLGGIVGAFLAIVREQVTLSIDKILAKWNIDKTTDVYTRDYFLNLLHQEIKKNQSGLFSIGLIQFDGLANTTLPPIYFQRLLQHATQVINNELRGHDIVGRWTRNTYIVLLPSTPSNAAFATLERVYSALCAPMVLEEHNFRLNLDPKVGITTRHGSESAKETVTRAQLALDTALQTDENIALKQVSSIKDE